MNVEEFISKISSVGSVHWIHEIGDETFLFFENKKSILKLRSICSTENKVILKLYWKYKTKKQVNVTTSTQKYFADDTNEFDFLEGIPQSTGVDEQMSSWLKNSAWFKNSASCCDARSYFIDSNISEQLFLEGIPQYEKYNRIIAGCGDM